MGTKIISPKRLPSDCVIFTTTAEGGRTYSKYSSQSLAYYSQLEDEYKLGRLITLHQQHGTDVVQVHGQNYLAADAASGDALFTTDCGTALGIISADCFPVFIIGNRCISALHCGWRGTVKGIISKVVDKFAMVNDIPKYAYIGPGISKDAFEVKADFINKVSKYINPDNYIHMHGGKHFFNLELLIGKQLLSAGISDVESSGLCTYRERNLHSYRRDRDDAGRMISVIYRKVKISD